MGIINLLPFYRWGFEILKEFLSGILKERFFAKTPGLGAGYSETYLPGLSTTSTTNECAFLSPRR